MWIRGNPGFQLPRYTSTDGRWSRFITFGVIPAPPSAGIIRSPDDVDGSYTAKNVRAGTPARHRSPTCGGHPVGSTDVTATDSSAGTVNWSEPTCTTSGDPVTTAAAGTTTFTVSPVANVESRGISHPRT